MVFGIGTMICTFGASHMTQSIDYDSSPIAKHMAWAAVNGLVGLSMVGLCGIAGGAIVQQAALITGCIIGGMSTAAMVSPSDWALQMVPYLDGGLGLFGLMTAHDAQRVLHDAQVAGQFDPVSEQMGLYLDTINIFVRVVQILMMSNRKK